MRLNHSLLYMLAVLLVVACTTADSAETLLKTESDGLALSEAVLLYDRTGLSSGATTDCLGIGTEKWYGSDMSFASLDEKYKRLLQQNGWEIWAEDVGMIWRKQTEKGLFTFSLEDLTDSKDLEVYQWANGSLPDTLLKSAQKYATTYVAHLSYMQPSIAKHCFRK